jgi:predicted RNA-binding Zn-ribbon protein involved in translation (DUF1610 family)
VRFLDVLSLEKIKTLYRYLPIEEDVLVGIFILRDPGEIDFKISCPSCGQKLWLRDTDVGKRGRCPNCKKPFIILSQADHIRKQLLLPASQLILTVEKGNYDSFQKAMLELLESKSAAIKPAAQGPQAEALKRSTVRINLQAN